MARERAAAAALPRPPTAEPQAVASIAIGRWDSPFDVLGPHEIRSGSGRFLSIRAFLPGAREAVVRFGKKRFPMERVHGDGFFEAVLDAPVRPGDGPLRNGDSPAPLSTPDPAPLRYDFEVTGADGRVSRVDDPYRFPPILTEFDLHLLREGTQERLAEMLGAHAIRRFGVAGVHFAVWAPNATIVSVVGSFNAWDPRAHPMRRFPGSGVWEIFVPGVTRGALYKFHLRTRLQGATATKADPCGLWMQKRPDTASIVFSPGRPRWSDARWMSSRARKQTPDAPVSIYEVHLGSWRRRDEDGGDRTGSGEGRWLSYDELADELIPYARDLGFTHLELLPVCEHPFDGSWGYQVVGYYAATSRFGDPEGFRRFVDRAHRAGLGVILDWVPAHFPKDAHGLGFFDGTHLYEHADPRRGHHKDWDTFIYNYARPEVVAFLLSNALFWLERYHVDGLRVDAVASMLYLDYSRKAGEWVPNRYGGRENLEAVEFLRRFNDLVHSRVPGAVTFAEESTAWPGVSKPVASGGLGFDYKWNLGWMHDTLGYFAQEPQHRRFHHKKLTFPLMYAFSERYVLPFSHDEVVHGKKSMFLKMPGDTWRRFATLRCALAWQFAQPGKKLLFMGSELAQRREWNHDRQLDWALLDETANAGVQALVRELNRHYRAKRALHELDTESAGFEWVEVRDEGRSVLSFLRKGRDASDVVLVVGNFTPTPRPDHRIGVPQPGRWTVLLNTDDPAWGGSGLVQARALASAPEPANGHPQHLMLTLPPLSVLYLQPERGKGTPRSDHARSDPR